MAFDKAGLDDYIDVAQRLADFRAAYPDGSLQPADLATPYRIEEIGGQTFIVYVAAAYRCSGDPQPGVGCAWEPFPGRTPYTKGSELMNAETSAWGRAIVAALAGDTRKSVASMQEVRNRAAERDAPAGPEVPEALEDRPGTITLDQGKAIHAGFTALGIGARENRIAAIAQVAGRPVKSSQDLSYREAQSVLAELHRRAAAPKDAQ